MKISRNGYHKLVDKNGKVMSQHSDLKEAYEKVSRLPKGLYKLIPATEEIEVEYDVPEPVPDPVEPDYPII